MTKYVTTIVAVLMLAGVQASPAQKNDAPSLTGTWNMGLQGGHVIPVALVLKQEDATLTGTIAMPTQTIGQTVEVRLTGGTTHGSITLSGVVENAKESTTITIKGALNDEGVIEGTLAVGSHELPYTAERLKERK
jgi:hypothetical protein